MKTPTLTVKGPGIGNIVKNMRALTNKRVLVGVPASTTERDDSPLTNAELGMIHEFGAPEANIPARPFLGPGVEGAEEKLTQQMEKAAVAAVQGSTGDIDAALDAIGLTAQSAVRAKITEGPFQPLAPDTIANRLRRGRTGDRPLIDTGKLRQSLTYVIRGRDEGSD